MSELVRAGLLTYADIGIEDDSRRREVNREHLYSNVVIVVEKDTVYKVVLELAEFFECQCISAKGQPSLAATEDLSNCIDISKGVVYVCALTDYDPTGYIIADTMRNQIETHLRNRLRLVSTFDDDDDGLPIERPEVILRRIGLTPDQLTAEEIERNKYTPKAKGLPEWTAKTGGIDGEPFGLELDAITSYDRIKGIFIEALREVVDPAKYIEAQRWRVAYRKALELSEIYVLKQFRNLETATQRLAFALATQYQNDIVGRDDAQDFFEMSFQYQNVSKAAPALLTVPDEVEDEMRNAFRESFADLYREDD